MMAPVIDGQARLSAWPTSVLPGLAHGWAGYAWVWLQLAAAGLMKFDRQRKLALLRRFQSELETPAIQGFTSSLIGGGSLPLVAAVAGSLDASFSKLLSPAVQRWQSAVRDDPAADVMLGAAGALLAAAEIESYAPGAIPRRFLKTLHGICDAHLDDMITRGSGVYLGLAHGLAGQLLAREVAHASLRLPYSSQRRRQVLDVLVHCRVMGPRNSALWPTRRGDLAPTIHGWCHGAPGIALALLAARELSGESTYSRPIAWALNGTVSFDVGPDHFCCGGAGRVQVLIEAYRMTGRRRWLDCASRLQRRFRSTALRGRHARGFHRGRLGLHYVRCRLAHPRLLPLPGLGPLSVSGGRRSRG